jgi:hypothetical protein
MYLIFFRPGRAGVNATGRGVLSMSGLSYGVVRVDQENSLTSLTLQDCGQVMPGCKYCLFPSVCVQCSDTMTFCVTASGSSPIVVICNSFYMYCGTECIPEVVHN